MGETTKIAWTDHTFNPWIGCTRIHEGCRNCYAEQQNAFRKWNGPGTWGPKAPRKVTSAANWRKPLAWALEAKMNARRERVFCASLADVLDELAPAEAQAQLWDLIRRTAARGKVGGLVWQLLTKRPERWELIPADVRELVWFGTSIADRKTAREWGARLVRAQGFAKKFISAEPLLEDVGEDLVIALNGTDFETMPPRAPVDWVIVGGESGPGARPFNLRWARNVVDRCREAGVAVFVKQLGRIPIADERQLYAFEDYRAIEHRTDKTHGGNVEEFPEDLRIQEFPS